MVGEKVSIITISYNSEKTIEKTFQSILKQSYRPLEYVLVDGGSTDGTIDLIKKYIPVFMESGIEVNFKSEPDKGISDAFNKGIERSTGDIIGIINSDDQLMENVLIKIVKTFDQNIDVVCGDCLWLDEKHNLKYVRKSKMQLDKLKYEMVLMHVGLYSVSVKIYTIMKSFFTAILTVLMPRMIYMLSNSDSISIQKFEQKVVLIYTSLVFPLATGLFVLSDSAILIVGGENYMGAVPSLQILSVSLLCSAMAYFLTCVVIIPRNKEKIMMSASATSAVANVILNLFFIKFLSESGAAITTAISEIIVFIIEYVGGKKNIFASHMFRHFLNIIIGCFCIVGVKYIVRLFIPNIIISAIIIIPVSIIVYLLALIICKDETIKIAIDFIRKRS